MQAKVHATFEVEGVYLTHIGGVPALANCRVHRKPAVDVLSFADFSDAARAWASEDVLVFDLAQIPVPAPDAFFVVGPSEGYRLGAAKPADGRFQRVSATVLSPQSLAAVLAAISQGPPLTDGTDWDDSKPWADALQWIA